MVLVNFSQKTSKAMVLLDRVMHEGIGGGKGPGMGVKTRVNRWGGRSQRR